MRRRRMQSTDIQLRFLFSLVLAFSVGTVLAEEEPATLENLYRVGDWALYRVDRESDLTVRYEITAIEGEGEEATATVVSIARLNGKVIRRKERLDNLGEKRTARIANIMASEGKRTIRVGDKDIATYIFTRTVEGGDLTYYCSDQVPVDHTVLVEEKGEDEKILELIDFGRGSAD